MVPLAFPPSADDDVLLKVQVRCRGCLAETFALAPVNRPPGGISAKRIFKKQRMFERMTFVWRELRTWRERLGKPRLRSGGRPTTDHHEACRGRKAAS